MSNLGLRMPGHDAVSSAPSDSLTRMVDVVDDDENDDDGFDDEFSSIISDKRQKTRRRRFCVCSFCLLTLLVCAVVFTFLGIAFEERRQNEGSKVKSLPPPPADLPNLCSTSSLSTVPGFNSCQSICEESECCHIPVGEPLSCLDGNEETCATYSASCLNLDFHDSGGNTGGDLMSQLEMAEEVVEACSKQSLKTPHGRSECEKLCSSKLCCFAEEESFNCAEDQSEMCIIHAACENLLGHTAKGSLPEEKDPDEKIKEELQVECSKESLLELASVAQCHELCQFHLCCFSDDADENCYNDHKVECDVYKPCAGLVHPPHAENKKDAGTHATSDMLVEACSTDSLAKPEGLQDCHALCGPHLCCFINPNLKSSCVDTIGETECNMYEPCKVLVNTDLHVTIPSPPSDLADKCSESNLETVAGFVECEERCDKAKCCEEPIENCVVTNPTMCDAYENACEGIKGRIPEAPSNINNLCSSSSLNTKDGFSECHQTCERAACCDLLDDACTVTNSERCGGYEICNEVFDGVDDYPDEFDTPTEVATGEMFVPDAPDDIKQICKPSAIQSVDGYTKCDKMCENAQCCNEPISVCKVLNPENCKAYEVCAVLKGDSAEIVDIFCEEESIKTEDGNEICESLCDQRSCCYADGSGNCYATDKAWCDEFKRCENLHKKKDVPADDDKSFDLHSDMDSCKSDQVTTKTGKEICKQICLGRECCFLEGLESCKEEEKAWCKEYNLCYIVFPDGLS